MAQDDGIKIRTLPRKNEKKKDEPQQAQPKPSTPRWIIYVGTSSCVLLASVLFLDAPKPQKPVAAAQKQIQQTSMASVATRQSNDKVSRHLQESHMRREMMVQAHQLENMKMKTANLEADPFAMDTSRTYGVQLDQEDTSDRVYEDLNINAKGYGESTPHEKINARLANRKWVNELERRERITFVRNFIRSAYDRGYEVQLDENLVVVGVTKVKNNRKLNIDQILDKIAKKGL